MLLSMQISMYSKSIGSKDNIGIFLLMFLASSASSKDDTAK